MNSSCFSLWSWKDLEPLMVKLPLQSDSISKMRMNNTTGFDLCKDCTEFLNQIGVTNIHEKNIIFQGINNLVYEQLKIKVYYNKEEYLNVQLENDKEFTIEKLASYLKMFFNNSKEVFISIMESDEILMPSFNLVNAVFSNPEKYRALTLCDIQGVKNEKKNSNVNNYSSSMMNLNKFNKNNESNIDNYELSNEHSMSKGYHYTNSLPDQKESIEKKISGSSKSPNITNYYQYSQILNKSKTPSYSGGNKSLIQTKDLVDDQEDFPESTEDLSKEAGNFLGKSKSKSYSTFKNINTQNRDVYKYKPNSKLNDKSEDLESFKGRDKDEINSYVQKGYGTYLPNTNLNEDDNSISTSNPTTTKEDYKKFSSEKRNYRTYQNNTPDQSPNNKIDNYQPKQYSKYSSSSVPVSNQDPMRKYSLNVKYQTKNIDKDYGNQGISAFELRNKVHSMRSQLNAFANQNDSIQNTNDYSNYKSFKRENEENSNLDNITQKKTNQLY